MGAEVGLVTGGVLRWGLGWAWSQGEGGLQGYVGVFGLPPHRNLLISLGFQGPANQKDTGH